MIIMVLNNYFSFVSLVHCGQSKTRLIKSMHLLSFLSAWYMIQGRNPSGGIKLEELPYWRWIRTWSYN